MKWHVDLTREQFGKVAMHVEWAVMAQHAAVVAKPPRSVGRLPAPVAIVLAVAGLLTGVYLTPSQPELGPMICGAFMFILAAWAVVLVRRAQPATRAGARIERLVERLLGRFDRMLPLSLDYELAGGKVETTGNRPGLRMRSIAATRAVVAVDVVALFRRGASLLPWRLIFSPPPELLDELRRRGTEVLEVTEAPSGYAEPLPVARYVWRD
jgi:hypothetical protein